MQYAPESFDMQTVAFIHPVRKAIFLRPTGCDLSDKVPVTDPCFGQSCLCLVVAIVHTRFHEQRNGNPFACGFHVIFVGKILCGQIR